MCLIFYKDNEPFELDIDGATTTVANVKLRVASRFNCTPREVDLYPILNQNLSLDACTDTALITHDTALRLIISMQNDLMQNDLMQNDDLTSRTPAPSSVEIDDHDDYAGDDETVDDTYTIISPISPQICKKRKGVHDDLIDLTESGVV